MQVRLRKLCQRPLLARMRFEMCSREMLSHDVAINDPPGFKTRWTWFMIESRSSIYWRPKAQVIMSMLLSGTDESLVPSFTISISSARVSDLTPSSGVVAADETSTEWMLASGNASAKNDAGVIFAGREPRSITLIFFVSAFPSTSTTCLIAL